MQQSGVVAIGAGAAAIAALVVAILVLVAAVVANLLLPAAVVALDLGGAPNFCLKGQARLS